jgi:hypothetical protein
VSPEELLWLLLFLLFLLLVLLWWLLMRGFFQPPQTPPVGWLLEAWNRGDEWTDVCDGNAGKVLYRNLSGRNMAVNLEAINGGNCIIEFSTAALPNFMAILPDKRGAAAVDLPNASAITYHCCRDASGEHCRMRVRIQKI